MKRILGYTAPWSAAPGETVAIHVSLLDGESYDLDVVRVISGDAGGLGLDLRPVASPLTGTYRGERQATAIGSAMIVPSPPAFVPADGLEIELWLQPTLPTAGRQGLLGCWSDGDAQGYLLEIDASGRLAFRIGGADGGAIVTADRPLQPGRWARVRASYEPAASRLRLALDGTDDPVAGPARTLGWTADTGAGERLALLPQPLVVAAVGDPARGRFHRCHFNGKLARPALSSGGRRVAAWDFAPGGGTDVDDPIGGHRGRLVNLPARAVTGPGWQAEVHDWRAVPDQYDAIHFHADDLYDAEWPVAHHLTVPADWASGYYAVRLCAGGDTSYLPLFVLPPRGRAAAPLAVLASTLTTIAYGNYRFHLEADMNEASLGRASVLMPEDLFLCANTDVGRSTYDLHADGSPVRFASRLRPIVNNWPGGEVWNLNADTHILAWLEQLGQPYDLVTDEELHAEGADLLQRYRAVIAGSHPEYWTTPMWDGLSGYLASGGRLLYLGGNGFYWRTAMSLAWPAAIELRRAEGGGRYTAELPGHHHMAFTGELGGLWRRTGRPPQALVGVGTVGIGFDGIGRFRRTPDADDPRAAWLFDGVAGDTFGAEGLLGSAAGSEIDATDAALGTPPHALVVARSEGHSSAMQPMPEEILMPHPAMAAPFNPRVCAEVLFFETASGGAVFSASSLTWTAALPAADFDSDVARITRNALLRFLEPAPFAWPGDD